MSDYLSKIAQLLRTEPAVMAQLEQKMEAISQQKGVLEKIVQENDRKVEQALKALGLKRTSSASVVYGALLEQVKKTNQALNKHFRQPDITCQTGCQSLINVIKEISNHLKGFYLKKEKAAQLLKKNPPPHIMAELGYGQDVDKMLEKEDLFEIFAALRFAEDSFWLNDVFFKEYQSLTKDDFELREIKLMVLPERWSKIGQRFLGKKLHHMSHLKELGLVFVIPVVRPLAGDLVYFFFMSLHYLYEVKWHADLFQLYSQKDNFASKMIEALKVEVSGQPLPNRGRMSWRIMNKYLAKHDSNDPRLFEPHINTEAWHYAQTAKALERFSQRFPETEMAFWQGLDTVGEYFPSDGQDHQVLISFDLFDNGISLLRQMGFESKYLYHQQEALWNQIFINYLGEETLDKQLKENFDQGFVVLE